MPVKWRNLLLGVLVVSVISAGVFVGRQVGAAGIEPGSEGDPLVAKSYVDSKIAGILDRITKLETDVAELRKSITQTPAPAPTPTTKRGVVNGSWVNIRTGPSTSYSIVTTVPKGTTAEVLGSQSGWYKIKLSNGTVGWIAGWLFVIQ